MYFVNNGPANRQAAGVSFRRAAGETLPSLSEKHEECWEARADRAPARGELGKLSVATRLSLSAVQIARQDGDRSDGLAPPRPIAALLAAFPRRIC